MMASPAPASPPPQGSPCTGLGNVTSGPARASHGTGTMPPSPTAGRVTSPPTHECAGPLPSTQASHTGAVGVPAAEGAAVGNSRAAVADDAIVSERQSIATHCAHQMHQVLVLLAGLLPPPPSPAHTHYNPLGPLKFKVSTAAAVTRCSSAVADCQSVCWSTGRSALRFRPQRHAFRAQGTCIRYAAQLQKRNHNIYPHNRSAAAHVLTAHAAHTVCSPHTPRARAPGGRRRGSRSKQNSTRYKYQ